MCCTVSCFVSNWHVKRRGWNMNTWQRREAGEVRRAVATPNQEQLKREEVSSMTGLVNRANSLTRKNSLLCAGIAQW